jgi:sodium-dependent dicarboxylate transporter 2/3/5
VLYFCPYFTDAADPLGESISLQPEGRAALALFALAAVWWIFEVIPIGVTSITVGVLQVLFLIRPAHEAFGDFMAPPVWFILGSITISMAFSRSGLTNRLAYGLLSVVGERTMLVYLGSFALTAGLTLIMAHTAVAATVFPLLMSIHALYADSNEPTRFGKGLFIGMAFAAGAGSIITFLGSARAAVAAGFLQHLAQREVSFFDLPYYMLPLAATMVLVIWALCLIFFPPEKKTIPGLTSRARMLFQRLGPMTAAEITSLVIVGGTVALIGLRSFSPALASWDKSAIILMATILFFVSGVLTTRELEEIPWNIVLLFGGATSIGMCLSKTGAASWLALKLLALVPDMPGLVFVMAMALVVLIITNFMLNVAVIALVLPVALVLAPYLGVAPEVVFYSVLVAAGMPFLLLTGSAPNAIAHESRQFTGRAFFGAGLPASVILMAVLLLYAWFIWPLLGMPVGRD